MKRKIVNILKHDTDPSVRFEVLEKFLDYINSKEDVIFLIKILKYDSDPCVRHKAAAHLFRIKEKNLPLSISCNSKIIRALIDRAMNDESTVVRHESIEALGYLAGNDVFDSLNCLINDNDPDVRSTAIIALGTAQRCLENNLSSNDVGNFLIKTRY